MTQIMIDVDRSRDTLILSMDPAIVRIYAAAAKERGMVDATALISALLADWPAILAPVEPKVRPIVFEDFPLGGGY